MTHKELINKVNKQGVKSLVGSEFDVYYNILCEQYGLNPATNPLDKLNFRGKTVLYAGRAASEQLIKKNKISIEILNEKILEGVYIVTSRIKMDNIYFDSIGTMCIENLKGEDKSNAFMKAHTKSVRRGVLSICGLGMLDESELEFATEHEDIKEETPVRKMELVKPAVQNEIYDFTKMLLQFCESDTQELRERKYYLFKLVEKTSGSKGVEGLKKQIGNIKEEQTEKLIKQYEGK